ncbi:MAG: hypothetical protein RR446_07400 [Lachnospiraceae bacterium]
MEKNEELVISVPQKEVDVKMWYESITYEDAKVFIKTNIISAARSFIAIGFYLKYVRDKEQYQEDGHASIWDFAQAEYGISKSTASRYMTTNDRFSKDGNSPVIAEPYKGFGKSQLQEMLSLNEEQLEQVTPQSTVQEIRGMRAPKEIPYFEMEGQMELSDFPEVLPESMQKPFQETTPLSQQSQNFVMDASDLFQEQEAIAISQQPETPQSEIHDENEEESEAALEDKKYAGIVDGEFTEIHEPEPKNWTDLQIAKKELDRVNDLLKDCMSTGIGDEDTHIRAMKIKVCAMASYVCDLEDIENPSPKPEQPELTLLKNNDQRAAFVDAYETWPLWIETKETGERYYRYNLADGTSMVVKVYHAMLFDYNAVEIKWEDRFKEGWGKHEYFLLQEGKFFRDCDTNRSQLIEKLKEIQKKGK